MRIIFLALVLLVGGIHSFGQKKMTGIGGELSVLSAGPNMRIWFSKTQGIDLFAGVSAEFADIMPDDYQGGIRYVHSFLQNKFYRTYLGVMGKWKYIKLEETGETLQMPAYGVFIGKEWYNKRTWWKGFSVELGYQYGSKGYDIFDQVSHVYINKGNYVEFPFIVNFRYSFYKSRGR